LNSPPLWVQLSVVPAWLTSIAARVWPALLEKSCLVTLVLPPVYRSVPESPVSCSNPK